MSIEFVTNFGRQALLVTLILSAPLLGFALLVGVIISIFQAVTQIQEMTLTFVPKIVVVMISIVVLINFTSTLFLNLPTYMKM